MRVLIISRTPWDEGNSFGNTFSCLFGGMENVEIYNICCQNGELTSPLVRSALQITEKSIVKALLQGQPVAKEMTRCPEAAASGSNKASLMGVVKQMMPNVGYVIRDAIWKCGGWKSSAELADFLKSAAPDVLYLPIYRSGYMCDFQNYIIDLLRIPAVGHITDDVYSLPSGFFVSPLNYLYQLRMQRKLKQLIAKCSYLEVFAENMQREYARLFGKECYLIGKGIDVSQVRVKNYRYPEPDREIRFLYTGMIGTRRWKLLCDIGDAISRGGYHARVDIYTGTELCGTMLREINKRPALHLNGFVPPARLAEIRAQADYMVHVEGADAHSIYETRMSFSTKIIDCLQADKPLFAYGSPEVNSIEVLRNHRIAIVADSDSIDDVLRRLVGQKYDLVILGKNVTEYLVEKRDQKTIQAGIWHRMRNLIRDEDD